MLSSTMLKMKLYSTLLSIILSLLIFNDVLAQARNSVGIGAGINLPAKTGYKVGRDKALQANIFAHKRFAIMPTLGIEDIKSNLRSDFNVGFLNLAAKYYTGKNFFIYAGPSCYVGGNDGGVVGLGGTAGIGYDWAFDDYSSLEVSARADVLPSYLHVNPLAGLRVAYKFNFSKKDTGKYRVPDEDLTK